MGLKILLVGNAPWVRTGYGQANYLLASLFRQSGHDVAIFANYGLEGSPREYDNIMVYPRMYEKWGNDVIDAHVRRFGANLVISNVEPWVLDRYGGREFHWYPIAPVSEDPLSRQYRLSLAGATGICAISRYGQEVLQEQGLDSDYMPLPVATTFYHPLDKAGCRKAFKWSEEMYVIGHVGMNRGNRKGMDLLLQAYRIVLSECPDTMLYLHTHPNSPDGYNLVEIIEALELRGRVVITSPYDAFFGHPADWMKAFYNAIDLYVQPALNEGQAMPVWEALCVGTPVVGVKGTAIAEALEDADAIAVEPSLEMWSHASGFGYVVSPHDLAQAIIEARYRFPRGFISAKNREKAIETVSCEVIGARWHNRLIELEKRFTFTPHFQPFPSRPHVVQVSTVEENCGIGQYTRNLMNALSNATQQECVDVRGLENEFSIPTCDIVHLHYEPAVLTNENKLQALLWEFRKHDIRVVVTFHTAVAELIKLYLTKKLIDVAIVHAPVPQLDSHPKLAILGGMGCPPYMRPAPTKLAAIRQRYGFQANDIILSTFGFASGARGHVDVLREMVNVLKDNPHVKFQLLLPLNFLSEQVGMEVYKHIEAIIKEHILQRQVHLVKDFLPEDEVLDRLWMSNAGFLFIALDTASSSSAIRHFISSRLPTVVNESHHFSDVERGVIRVPGYKIRGMVEALWDLANDEDLQTQLRREHEITYANYVWPRFAEKVFETYKLAYAKVS